MISNDDMYKVDDAEGNEMMWDQNHITKSFQKYCRIISSQILSSNQRTTEISSSTYSAKVRL